ncbi:hypothetical protein [Paenibacillus swuensis]|nr:hypothetical protein [Paenibacillus swuensis]
MGTRLWSEYLIKKHHPHLKYVRVHTSGRHSAVIYAWNEDLSLTNTEMTDLMCFASNYFLPHVCFQVKGYSAIQTDKVPPTDDLPEPVVAAAMSRKLDQYMIVDVISSMFERGRMTFRSYNEKTGTIYYDLSVDYAVTDFDKELVHKYLYEIIPLGSRFEIAYLPYSEAAGNSGKPSP